MRFISYLKAGAAGLVAAVLLGSCDAPLVGSDSFKDRYFVARDALEGGDYPRAGRTYAKLLPEAGALTPRLRLEYAHSFLRAGDYVAAAREAGQIARSLTGTPRSAALAVEGTAQHELALLHLGAGKDAAAKPLLTKAAAALDEVLKNDPQLDPLGALAGRKAQIAVQLKRL